MSDNNSDGSFELPGMNGSTTAATSSASASDPLQYVSGRRSNTMKKKKEKKERRKSSRNYSTTSTTSTASNGSNSKSMSSLGMTQQDAHHSSLSKVTPDNYYDDPSVPSAYSTYAESKYVRPKTPPTPVMGTDEKDSLLLETPSENYDPDDPLANLSSYEDVFKDEEVEEAELEYNRQAKQQNFGRFGKDGVEKRTPLQQTLYYIKLYCIPIVIAILFVLGIVAGILYLVKYAGQAPSTTTTKIAQAVPVAPESIKLMCDQVDSHGSVNPFRIPDLCQAACVAAECCWNPDGNFVCTTDTAQQCPPYEQECLQWKDAIAALHSSLDTNTIKNSTVTIDNDNDNDSPSATTTMNQGQTVLEMDVPLFPAGLTTSCVRTAYEVSDDCRQGCAEAECCWDKTTTVLCSQDTVHNCGNFKEVCEYLNDLPTPPPTTVANVNNNNNNNNWPFPSAPQGLSIYCDPAEMEEVSLHICEDKCGQAECCWKTGVQSCASLYPEACHDYTQACAILNDLETAPGNNFDTTTETAPPESVINPNTIPEAPSDLTQTCAHDRITNVNTGGEALIECEQVCLKAGCCWQPNTAQPCTDNERCSAYQQPCSIFVNLFEKPDNYNPASETLPPHVISDVPEAASNIAMTCSKDVLKTSVDNGKFIVECEKECLKAACCWKQNHPTTCPEASECAAYREPCGTNLVGALTALEGGGSGSTPAAPPPATAAPSTAPPTTTPPTTQAPRIQADVPEAHSDIQMMCSPDVLKLSVSEGDFIVECEKECLEGACCWKENNPTICPQAAECVDYVVPCKEHLVPALEQLEGTDHNLPLSGSTGDNTDTSGGSDNNNSGANIPAAPSDIQDRCSLERLSNNGRGNCEDACNLAQCCWNPATGASACPDNQFCSGYTICQNLLSTAPIQSGTVTPSSGGGGDDASSSTASSSTPTAPVPPDDLSSICSAGALIEMQGLEKCRAACTAADCCWATGDASCSSATVCTTWQTDCELMRKELSLSDSSGSNNNGGSRTVTRDEISSTCDNRNSDFDRSTCEALCRPGSCCFDDTACTGSTDCTIYEACSVLTRRMLRHG